MNSFSSILPHNDFEKFSEKGLQIVFILSIEESERKASPCWMKNSWKWAKFLWTVQYVIIRRLKAEFLQWWHDYLPLRFFLNVYIRIFIESFFIVMATAMSELLHKDFSKTGYRVSYCISIGICILYSVLFILLFLYFLKHRNTDLSSEDGGKTRIYFDGKQVVRNN